jgi:hypothetical protein
MMDCLVVVQWTRLLETHAAEALLRTWEQQTLAVCAPQHLVLM